MKFQKLASIALAFYAIILLIAIVDSRTVKLLEHCRTDAYPPPESLRLKTEIVNLDFPPRHRWRSIVWPRRSNIQAFVNIVKRAIPVAFSSDVFKKLETLAHKMPNPYREEMIGISETLNIPLGEILACNLFYELAGCTSILAQDENGKVYHSRNLDFDYLAESGLETTKIIKNFMHPLTVNIEFQTGGKTIYKALQYAGAVGVYTGVSPGKFSVSINSRNTGADLIQRLTNVFTNINRSFAAFLLRDALLKAGSFQEAKKMLSTTELFGPVYFIIGGAKPNEGVVLSRSGGKSLQPMTLNAKTRFLVQTNNDHWEAGYTYYRRDAANYCVNSFYQASSQKKNYPKLLYNVMATVPVRNEATTYTAIMCAKTGLMESYNTLCTRPVCKLFQFG